MDGERQGYQAYLVRLWRVCSGGQWVWRAALESPHTGERHVFATLAALFTFLESKTRQEAPRSGIDRQDVDDDSVPCKEEERHDV
jgi:hypothetical protein